MATVTGLTAQRMIEIEDASVVDGSILGDDLILVRHDGSQINAGNVRGPQGIQGPTGEVPEAPLNATAYARSNGLWVPVPKEAPSDGKNYTRKDGAWVDSQWLLDLLASSHRDLAWTPSIAAPHSIASADAVRLGPIVFAQAELNITAASTDTVSINLPVSAPVYRSVGWASSFGVSDASRIIGTFRTNGSGTTASLLHSNNSLGADFTSGDKLAISLVYIPDEEPLNSASAP